MIPMDFEATDLLKLAASIIICQLAGIIGTIFTSPKIDTWYAELSKPFFNPPSWVFAPVWTILFILMGISLYLVWRKGFDIPRVRAAMIIFSIHLVLNVAWSAVFFGAESLIGGFVVIALLWFSIFVTILRFYDISKKAGYLFIPYILWVTFAAILNLWIWYLN